MVDIFYLCSIYSVRFSHRLQDSFRYFLFTPVRCCIQHAPSTLCYTYAISTKEIAFFVVFLIILSMASSQSKCYASHSPAALVYWTIPLLWSIGYFRFYRLFFSIFLFFQVLCNEQHANILIERNENQTEWMSTSVFIPTSFRYNFTLILLHPNLLQMQYSKPLNFYLFFFLLNANDNKGYLICSIRALRVGL